MLEFLCTANMNIAGLGNTILYGFVAGVVGTAIGAVIPMFAKLKNDKVIALMMSFAGGFMVAVVFFDLLPQSIQIGGIWASILSCIGGILLIMGLNKLSEKPIEKLQTYNKSEDEGQKKFMRIGAMMVIAIGLHNLPEGMAIGSLEAADGGMLLALLICLHNIPEGMAISAPLLRAGVSRWKTFLMAIVTGLPTVLGAVIGFLAGSISSIFIAICLSVAAGAMLFIVYGGMLKDSYMMSGKTSVALFNLGGILLGVLLISLL